jgi:hypothetical protein
MIILGIIWRLAIFLALELPPMVEREYDESSGAAAVPLWILMIAVNILAWVLNSIAIIITLAGINSFLKRNPHWSNRRD